MTTKLNNHVLETLGLSISCSRQDLESKLERVSPGHLGIFHSAASKEALLGIADNGCNYKLETLPAIYKIEKWVYHHVMSGVDEIAHIVHIPDSGEGLPPTEAEKVIASAWHLDKAILGSPETGEINLITNKVLFLWNNNNYEKYSEANRTAIRALLHVGQDESESLCDSEWWGKPIFNLEDKCILLSVSTDSKTNLMLFKSAICEASIRWRFLSLYRILERGYLSAILTSIKRDFMKAPDITLTQAQQDLRNECAQFVRLAKEHGLDIMFGDFADRAKLLSASNKYVAMLQREFDADKNLRKNLIVGAGDKYVKGVILCYKVRCSIVHSGSTSLVLDEFDDANTALRAFVVPLEAAVMQYMGIQSLEL